jgi:hypothetical protein
MDHLALTPEEAVGADEALPVERPEFGIAPVEVPKPVVVENGMVRIGDIERAKRTYEQQVGGTCGLASIAGLLRFLGFENVQNTQVVEFAKENSLVTDERGGTYPQHRIEILRLLGVPSHLETFWDPVNPNLERLAHVIESGEGAIISVNAGVLWREELGGAEGEKEYRNNFETGGHNHIVEVVGLQRDPGTGELRGFYINDTGVGKAKGAGAFISLKTMQEALVGVPGKYRVQGEMIVTELRRPAPMIA